MAGRKWFLAAGALAAVAAVALGVGAVVAQSSGGGEDGSFLDRVAAKLGIESEQLEQAIDDTRAEDLDAAVERGDLTQEQADRLKERMGGMPPFAPAPFFRHGNHEIPSEGLPEFDERFEFDGGPLLDGLKDLPALGAFAFGLAFDLPEMEEDFADFLGISTEQLRDELSADDATLASVAEAHGKTRDELKAFISTEAREKLDEAVADDTLSQEQADRLATRLDEHLDDLIDFSFPGGGFIPGGEFHFDFDFRHGGDDDAPGDDAERTPAGAASFSF